MSNWYEPILFGFILITFVLGVSSIIMSFSSTPEGVNSMQSKIEYGFFGASAFGLFAVFVYALVNA
jgi:hypothetical protein